MKLLTELKVKPNYKTEDVYGAIAKNIMFLKMKLRVLKLLKKRLIAEKSLILLLV